MATDPAAAVPVPVGVLGTIDSFDPNSDEDVHEYLERVELYFETNRIIENRQKRSVFLTVVGKEAYHLLSSLAAPEKLSQKSFEDTGKFCFPSHCSRLWHHR